MTRHSLPPELRDIARDLRDHRREPSATFRLQSHAQVIERTMTDADRRRSRTQAGFLAAAGTVLLAVAALSIGGAGPFGL